MIYYFINLVCNIISLSALNSYSRMNFTVEDIKKLLDNDEFIRNEIQKYCKEKEKEQELESLKNVMREKFTGNLDNDIIDEYLCLVHDLQVNNSNFILYGCRHEVRFRLANMKVSYNFHMHSPNRGGDSMVVSVDDNPIIYLDYNTGRCLSEIKLFYNFNDYGDDEFSDNISREDIEKFINISKTHFPDEKPDAIFYIILSILCYYYEGFYKE